MFTDGRKSSRLISLFLAACFFIISVLSGCAAVSKPDGTDHKYDATITSKVKSAIQNDSSLDMADINVETYKGVVQLSGFVDSPEDIRKAGDIAAGVPGIISVKNDLIVKNLYSVS
jgi:osmotically-inducible protein OsmY